MSEKSGLARCGCGARIVGLQSPNGAPWNWVAVCEREHRMSVPNKDVTRILDGFSSMMAAIYRTPAVSPDKDAGSQTPMKQEITNE